MTSSVPYQSSHHLIWSFHKSSITDCFLQFHSPLQTLYRLGVLIVLNHELPTCAVFTLVPSQGPTGGQNPHPSTHLLRTDSRSSPYLFLPSRPKPSLYKSKLSYLKLHKQPVYSMSSNHNRQLQPQTSTSPFIPDLISTINFIMR